MLLEAFGLAVEHIDMDSDCDDEALKERVWDGELPAWTTVRAPRHRLEPHLRCTYRRRPLCDVRAQAFVE